MNTCITSKDLDNSAEIGKCHLRVQLHKHVDGAKLMLILWIHLDK